jgi:uncharacterized protein YdhG (YjbR/CyaY superfamily)
MGELSDYLDGLDEPARAALTHVCDVARRAVPGLVEGRSYGVPALLHQRNPLVGVQATAKHLSVIPYSAEVVAAVAPELEGFSLSKGTIRFSAEQPIPDAVLARIVDLRRAEIDAKACR